MIMDNRFLVARRRYDPDATRYINAVQLADGQALEPEVAMAVDTFVRGCKADGIWDAIKASCILCGARTISGALVPLAGAAPTAYPQPVNFVSADYDRTGLKGDGITKYLDTNRADTSEPQNDNHISVFVSDVGTVASQDYCGTATATAEKLLRKTSTGFSQYLNNDTTTGATLGYPSSGSLFASSRSNGASYTYRLNGTSYPRSVTSTGVNALNAFVFARNFNGSALNLFDGRLAFYSFGSALDLAALDARVSTLVSQIAAAI